MIPVAAQHRLSLPRRRPGFTLLELMISLFILGVCATVLARWALWQATEHRRRVRHTVALETASNFMERLRARPWEALAAPMDEVQQLPDDAARLLPQGEVQLRVAEQGGAALPCRRLSVEVRWMHRSGKVKSVSLVAFRCPRTVQAAGPANQP